jgi:hypothetical protein
LQSGRQAGQRKQTGREEQRVRQGRECRQAFSSEQVGKQAAEESR